MSAIGVLGGTFDPVHNGHLRVALEMRNMLSLSEVRLIPVGRPAHRAQPIASGELRLSMLRRAVEGIRGLKVDDRELERSGDSFTVDTLASLREQVGDTPICLIIGMDQFHSLDQWHEWRKIIALAHICVARRPGSAVPTDGPVARLLSERQVSDPGRVHEAASGYIFLGAVPVLDISSTRIRALIAHRQDPDFLLPGRVLEFIQTERIYDE